jgi:hypothetical protein
MHRKITKIIFSLLFCANAFAQLPAIRTPKEIYQEHITKGNNFLKEGKYDEAIAQFDQAMQKAGDAGLDNKEAKEGLAKAEAAQTRKSDTVRTKLTTTLAADSGNHGRGVFGKPIGDPGKINLPPGDLSSGDLVFNGSVLNKSISQQKLVNDINALVENNDMTTSIKKENNNEPVFEAYEKRFSVVTYKPDVKWLYDSTSEIINRKKGKQIPELLLYIHLRSVLYHTWNIMDEVKWDSMNLHTAKSIIQKTIATLENNNFKTEKIYFALAGFENLLSRYYRDTRKGDNGLAHLLRAIDYAKQAITLNPSNSYYLRSLYSYVQNIQFLDNKALPLSEKNKFLPIECKIAGYMKKNISNKSISLFTEMDCTNDDANQLINAGKYKEAIALLDNAVTYLAGLEVNADYDNYGPILLSVLYNKLCYIYNYYEKDLAAHKSSTQKSLYNLVRVLSSHISQQKVLDYLKVVYEDLVSNTDIVFTSSERLDAHRSITGALENNDNDYWNLHELAYIFAMSNSILGIQLLYNATATDSIAAMGYLTKAINTFEETKMLKYYNNYEGRYFYSDDYAKFASLYNKMIGLQVRQNHYTMAKKYYDGLMKTFNLIFKDFRYDFYFVLQLVFTSSDYGQFLYNQKKFSDALAPLKFASLEGIKQSTDYLVRIYQAPEYKNVDSAARFSKRSIYQSEGTMTSFTLPMDCAGVFIAYALDRAKEHPYKGIDDQVKWLRITRGCKVTEDITKAINDIQQTAWNTNSSFKAQIAGIVRNNAKEKVLEGYQLATKEIENENDDAKKQGLFNQLMSKFVNGIAQDTSFSKDILADVMTTFNNYLNIYLVENDSTKGGAKDKIISLHKKMISTEESYLKLEMTAGDRESAQKTLSIHYNSLGWYCLLSKRYDSLIHYFTKSIELDPTSVYPVGNLPHAYLFNKQFEKAKAEYLRLKDIPFDTAAKLPTYKDAFQADFKDFKKEGLMNDDLKAIMQLLGVQ